MFENLKDELAAYLKPVLEEIGGELVEIKVGMYSHIKNIRVFVDKGTGGINIEECSRINRRLIAEIDAHQLINGDFTVEVSSPGLDWPLKTPADFRRVLNRNVRFHLSEMIEGKIEHSGFIREVYEDSVKLETKDKAIVISISKINKAVQIVE